MNRPATTKETMQAARKARLAKALKANIKKRKAPPGGGKQGAADGEER